VSDLDFPVFKDKTIHNVCSTYSLAREIEWTTRLFVLDMIDEDEEGIGTMLEIDHLAPALEGQEIKIEANLESVHGKELICSYTVSVDGRTIAKGKTGQKILKKDKLLRIFSFL
jgi:predicted thioesterase